MTRAEQEALVEQKLGPGVQIPYWFGTNDDEFFDWLERCTAARTLGLSMLRSNAHG